MEGARIGENYKIFPGLLFLIPQDLKFNGEDSVVEIGNETTIREYSTINRGTSVTGKTIIGENCLVMHIHMWLFMTVLLETTALL